MSPFFARSPQLLRFLHVVGVVAGTPFLHVGHEHARAACQRLRRGREHFAFASEIFRSKVFESMRSSVDERGRPGEGKERHHVRHEEPLESIALPGQTRRWNETLDEERHRQRGRERERGGGAAFYRAEHVDVDAGVFQASRQLVGEPDVR